VWYTRTYVILYAHGRGHSQRGGDRLSVCRVRVGGIKYIPPGRPRGCDCEYCVCTTTTTNSLTPPIMCIYVLICVHDLSTCVPTGRRPLFSLSRARAHTHTRARTGRAKSRRPPRPDNNNYLRHRTAAADNVVGSASR